MKTYTLEIKQDTDPQCPWEDDEKEAVQFYANCPYFPSVNTEKTTKDYPYRDVNEIMKQIKRDLGKGWYLFPVRLYEHSGTSLSLSSGYPFNDQWDSMLGGILCINPSHWGNKNTNKQALKSAEGLITTWNDYLCGNVWGYVINDEEGNTIESCWGYIGDREYCEKEGQSVLNYLNREQDRNWDGGR